MIVPSTTQFPPGPFRAEYTFWAHHFGESYIENAAIYKSDTTVAQTFQRAICQLESNHVFEYLGCGYGMTLYLPFFVRSLTTPISHNILGDYESIEEFNHEPAFILTQDSGLEEDFLQSSKVHEIDRRILSLIGNLDLFKLGSSFTIYQEREVPTQWIPNPSMENLVNIFSLEEQNVLCSEFFKIYISETQLSLMNYLKALSATSAKHRDFDLSKACLPFPKKEFLVAETFWSKEGFELIALKVQRFLCDSSSNGTSFYAKHILRIPYYYEGRSNIKPAYQLTLTYLTSDEWYKHTAVQRTHKVFIAARTILSQCCAMFSRRFIARDIIEDC